MRCLRCILAHKIADSKTCDSPTFSIDEHWRFFEEVGFPSRKIVFECGDRFWPQRAKPFFLPLAEEFYLEWGLKA